MGSLGILKRKQRVYFVIMGGVATFVERRLYTPKTKPSQLAMKVSRLKPPYLSTI